jgi:hypothetical protein
MRIAEHTGCQLDIELEPYRTLLSSELSVAEFQGEEKAYNSCVTFFNSVLNVSHIVQERFSFLYNEHQYQVIDMHYYSTSS